MTRNHHIAVAALFALLIGCTQSHGLRGEPCGANRCGEGEYCCNASCGICAPRGTGCPAIACVDGGPPLCGATACALDEICCPGCPGGGSFCTNEAVCPVMPCPAPPPGCESCRSGELCCPGCPGTGSFCTSDPVCPDLDCPAPLPGCETCAAGDLCCPGCPGAPSMCVSGPACPDLLCPPPPECDPAHPCPDGLYCAHDGCGGPGTCQPRPSACTEDCPGVCGCDGHDYCNACLAEQSGVSVAHEGSCAAPSCEGLSYCACTATPGCAPLIDLTPGCVCPCDDPFNCTGELCECDCGGAQYRGCVAEGRCTETELRCDPGCEALRGADGCLACGCG